MISSKSELKEFLYLDAKANYRNTIHPRLFGDEVWKFILTMRKLDYYSNAKKKNLFFIPLFLVKKIKYHNLSVKLGFSIPYNVFDKGLSISHYGTIVVNKTAKVGKNCRIHENVNIGATNGNCNSPILGDNVFIGTGASIIGDIKIADGVCIAAGAVVVKSITEPNTTWGGVPAKKISNNSSKSNLSPLLFQ